MSLLATDQLKISGIRAQIKALPMNDKTKLQQLALVDEQGYIYIIESTGDSFKIESKQQVFQKEINFLDTLISQTEKDRLIYAAGSVVSACTKKLRNYFTFDTSSADQVKFAFIEATQFFVVGEFMLNEYTIINEKVTPLSFYLSPDRINCMQIHLLSTKAHAVLGCQDSCVRILQQDQVLYVIQLTAPVLVIHNYAPQYKNMTSASRADQRKCFVFGLEDGTVLIADLGINKAEILYSFKTSSLSCLKPFDFFKTGQSDIIISTQDGTIEVYGLEDNFELKASKKINEGIISIEVGCFQLPNSNEIVISTFSGRIILLRELASQPQIKEEKRSIKELEQKIKQLKLEVLELEGQLKQQQGQSVLVSKFKIQNKLLKNEKDGSFRLIVDCQYPIEMITLSSKIQLERQCYQINDVKCNNYEINIKIREGEYGIIQCYVTPRNMQVSQSFQIEIKPLMLYQSINLMSIKHLPLNTLSLKGNFTKTDMNMWLNQLADIPTNQEDTVTHLLRNSFTDTYVQMKFKQGQALFKSDSVIAIQCCKQFIVNQANQRSIQMEVKWECNDESVIGFLHKLKQIQEEYIKFKKNHEILPALKELLIDNPVQTFSREFQLLINSEQEIIQEFNNLPQKLQYLQELVIETYKARCSLKAIYDLNIPNVKSLWSKDLNELIQFVLK